MDPARAWLRHPGDYDYVLLSHLPAFHLGMELVHQRRSSTRSGMALGISCLSRRVIAEQLALRARWRAESAIAPADAHAVADPSPAEAYF